MDNKTRNGIITVAVVAVLGAVAFKLLKAPKGGNAGGGGTGGGTGGGGSTGGGTGAGNLDYRALANEIFDACDGYGTGEDSIVAVFQQLRNNADFDALQDAYGVREVSSGTWNVFQTNFEGDLSSTLRDELSSSWISKINGILSSKGINRQI